MSLEFIHQYLPQDRSRRAAPPAGSLQEIQEITLLLLHGTGGDEEDLLPLGRTLLPGAGILSPRGQVLEDGMNRFFRRHAQGLLDQEDLENRTNDLADFIDQAARVYQFDRSGVVAVGFSNGANIATSLLLRHGAVLKAAVLLSPMLPFEPESLPDLSGVEIFIGAGRNDPFTPVEQVEHLATLLQDAGANLAIHWDPGGHILTSTEVAAAKRWMTTIATAASDKQDST